MSQDVHARILRANHRIEAVTSTNESFLDNARANAVPRDVPSELKFDGDSLVVAIFGHEARSTPRVVRVEDDFYMEYRFLIRFGEEHYEVTRFYVGAGGLVLEDLESESRICDYDNDNIASHICSRVALGILESPALAVAKKG